MSSKVYYDKSDVSKLVIIKSLTNGGSSVIPYTYKLYDAPYNELISNHNNYNIHISDIHYSPRDVSFYLSGSVDRKPFLYTSNKPNPHSDSLPDSLDDFTWTPWYFPSDITDEFVFFNSGYVNGYDKYGELFGLVIHDNSNIEVYYFNQLINASMQKIADIPCTYSKFADAGNYVFNDHNNMIRILMKDNNDRGVLLTLSTDLKSIEDSYVIEDYNSIDDFPRWISTERRDNSYSYDYRLGFDYTKFFNSDFKNVYTKSPSNSNPYINIMASSSSVVSSLSVPMPEALKPANSSITEYNYIVAGSEYNGFMNTIYDDTHNQAFCYLNNGLVWSINYEDLSIHPQFTSLITNNDMYDNMPISELPALAELGGNYLIYIPSVYL